jgi:hypothetical protein
MLFVWNAGGGDKTWCVRAPDERSLRRGRNSKQERAVGFETFVRSYVTAVAFFMRSRKSDDGSVQHTWLRGWHMRSEEQESRFEH